MKPKFAQIRDNFKVISIYALSIWAAYPLAQILPLHQFGLLPRRISGLVGIGVAPFLHGNLTHLTMNTLSLLPLGMMLAVIEGKHLRSTLLMITLIQGSLTWAFARSAYHIGASGVIFGLFSHILFLGYFHRRFMLMLASVFTALVFGTMIYGIFPQNSRISWEAHLFGFIAGFLTAKRKISR